MKNNLKNLLRIFLDSIRDYELEGKNRICEDERTSEEFTEIFLDSEDAFEYHNILANQNFNKALIKHLAEKYARESQFKSDFPHHYESVVDGYTEGFRKALEIIYQES